MNLRLIGEFVNKNITISECFEAWKLDYGKSGFCGSLKHQVLFLLP